MQPLGAPARPSWSVGHACLLGGGVVTLAAALGAWQFSATPAGPSWVDEAGIRELVRASSLDAVLRAWQVFEQSGPQPPPPNQERRAQATSRIAGLLWIIASVGAVVAVAGAVSILTLVDASPGRHEPGP